MHASVVLVIVFQFAAFFQADPPSHEVRTYNIDSQLAAKRDSKIDESLSQWLEFYKTCHSHPELSLQEKESAARIAKVLRDAGAQVTEGVGGYGVVGVLENGKGPTLLIRADLDALPITEDTGAPYASKVRVKLDNGSQVGVMHACGHDVHQTVFAATVTLLSQLRDSWSGKIIFVAQPAEEIGRGAAAMLNAGLFKRFGKPDACIALHVSHEIPAGTIGYTCRRREDHVVFRRRRG